MSDVTAPISDLEVPDMLGLPDDAPFPAAEAESARPLAAPPPPRRQGRADTVLVGAPAPDLRAMQQALGSPMPGGASAVEAGDTEVAEDDLPLRDFLAQWRYEGGVSYIHLVRRHPQQVRRFNTLYNIGGLLEEVTEPFDEMYVSQRWGGGTYVAEVFQYQPALNRSICIKRRTIPLSGSPVAYRGPNGDPLMLPPEQAPAQGQQQPPQGWPQNIPWTPPQGGWYPQFPYQQQQQQPQLQPRNLMEAMQLQQGQQKTLELMQRTVEKSADAQTAVLKTQLEATRQDLDTLRKEQAAVVAQGSRPAEAALDAMRNAVEQQRSALDRTLQEQRAQHESALKEMVRNNEKQLDALRAQHESQMTALRLQAESEKANVRAIYEGQIANLNRELDRAERAAKDGSATVVQMLSGQYEARLAALQAEVTHARDLSQSEVSRIKDMRDTELKRIEGDLQAVRTELAAERVKQGKSAMDSMKDTATMLQSVGGLAEAMGFQRPDAAGAAAGADDSTLGKLAMAAPLVEKVMGPLMSRVDYYIQQGQQAKLEAARAAAAQQHYQGGYMVQPPMVPVQMPPQLAPVGTQIAGPSGGVQTPSVQAAGPPAPIRDEFSGGIQGQQQGQPQWQQPPQGQQQVPMPGAAGGWQTPAPVSTQDFLDHGVNYLAERFDGDMEASVAAAELVRAIDAETRAMMAGTSNEEIVSQVQQQAVGSSLTSPRGKQWLMQVAQGLR